MTATSLEEIKEKDLFESFAERISNVTGNELIPALAHESDRLQHDLAFKNPGPIAQVVSVLCFCRFVDSERRGVSKPLLGIAIPETHLGFYRKTVFRLAEAGELGPGAANRFEDYFAKSQNRKLHFAVATASQPFTK